MKGTEDGQYPDAIAYNAWLHAAARCEVWPSLKRVSLRGGPNELVEGAEAEDESWIAVPPPPSLLFLALKPMWRGSTPTPSHTTLGCTPPPDARSARATRICVY